MTGFSAALAEEIGDPDFFVGREREMQFYLDWAENAKRLHSKSQALLARRKKGKTALVQRLFNILYHRNDRSVVPFFFRVPEEPLGKPSFGKRFYRAFVSQYLGFCLRDSDLVNEIPDLERLKTLAADYPKLLDDLCGMERIWETEQEEVWSYAQAAPHRIAVKNDIRIIQIIDEFQYLNRFIYNDGSLAKQVDLCHSYMGLAESKYAPLLVTGSYIGWLSTILSHMTARFEDRELGGLTNEEALAAAYNYSALTGRPVTEDTAAYIAELAHNDPFYISQMVRTQKPDLDLTTREGVREALQFETTYGKGYVAKIWMEYIAEGIPRVNDVHGKKMVLYLARDDREQGREEIAKALDLSMSDEDLAQRLYKLKQADLIAGGSSAYHFKGLGDPIFAEVFRKHYGPEIERLTPVQIADEFDEQMKCLKRQTAWYKGLAGEHQVMNFLLQAALRNADPSHLIDNPTPGFTFKGYTSMRKHSFHLDQTRRREVDLYARNTLPDHMDLIVEVKAWDRQVSQEAVQEFISVKEALEPVLNRPTAFLLVSKGGFSDKQKALMQSNGVMYATFDQVGG